MLITFFLLEVYGDFSRLSLTANSTLPGWILLKFEPVRDLMVLNVGLNISYKQEQLTLSNKC